MRLLQINDLRTPAQSGAVEGCGKAARQSVRAVLLSTCRRARSDAPYPSNWERGNKLAHSRPFGSRLEQSSAVIGEGDWRGFSFSSGTTDREGISILGASIWWRAWEAIRPG